MWCLCEKKDGRPIKLGVDDHYAGVLYTIGFATKTDLISAVGNRPKHDEIIRRIDFEY